MAANRLLFSDDFSSYTSDADVLAAYPDAYSVNSADWGATFGPDGQPGIKDQVSAPVTDTGDLEKLSLATECHAFKVKGRWNHAATNAILSQHSFLRLQWISADGSEAEGIITLNANHSSGNLQVVISTQSPYGNFSGNNFYVVTVPNGLPLNTPNTVEVNGRRSTMTETSPGVWSPEPDGEVHVLVGGVEVASFSGPVWTRRTDQNPSPYWNAVLIKTVGAFSDLEIWDETGCVPEVGGGIALCPPCVTADPDTVDSGGEQGAGASPWIQPAIGQQLVCAGGGLVPTQADIVPSELWWGL